MVSESRLLGPVAVLGDFNAHLGLLEGESQGVLCRSCGCEVSAVSLGSLASGPTYTYCSNVQTTVDYNLMDVKSASMTTSCVNHEMSDLNTSDHFPLAVSLVYSTVPMQDASENQKCNAIQDQLG